MNSGKICVSVTGETADEMISNIKRAEKFADIVEVRFDSVRQDQISNLRSQISDLSSAYKLLITFRSSEQGGLGNASLNERREFWQSIDNDNWATDTEEDLADIPFSGGDHIVSHHDFTGTPDDLVEIFDRLTGRPRNTIKIAVTANDIVDAIPIWQLIHRAKAIGKEMIPIAMSEAGKWTRILGLAHGAFLTYASLGAGQETADGQITAEDMRDVYRVKDLNKETKVFGVVGYPASSSLSPFMHNPAFAATGENAVFIPLQVRELDEFVRRMVRSETREVELNFGGFSVTMPHKQAIVPHLDAVDQTAEKIGAVNTIKIDGDKLVGYNTDAHGFITPLKQRFGDLKGVNVAMFGAGGAARACVFALKCEGASVTVFAREPKKAEGLGREFGVDIKEFQASSVDSGKLQVGSFDILVDATPLGMKGPLENETLFSAEELLGVKFVCDLVTKSSDTPLVAEAKKAGIPAICGIEMLIAQGAMQFEIWTGREAPVELMRSSLLAKMKR